MPISIDHATAATVLRAADAVATQPLPAVGAAWLPEIVELSRLCPPRKSATCIAAFGTAVLAKAVNPRVDVYSLLDRGTSATSYSARSLADNVWAKLRGELEVDLGANGPWPLNNTPFIGKSSIRDIGGVTNKQGWTHFHVLLERLDAVSTVGDARQILAAFIAARRRSLLATVVMDQSAGQHLALEKLATIIQRWVAAESEGGCRAQAAAAGIIDTVFGDSVVSMGKINDPDRRAPMDVAVTGAHDTYVLAYEVKDKPVGEQAVRSSIEKARSSFPIENVCVLSVGSKQGPLADGELERWARERGVNLSIVYSWSAFISAAAVFGTPIGNHPAAICRRVMVRAEEVGVSEAGRTSFAAAVSG